MSDKLPEEVIPLAESGGERQPEAKRTDGKSHVDSAPGDTTDLLKESVVAALKTVYDPEIPVNIYELGLIYNIIIDEDQNVHVDMTLTSPACPAAQELPAAARRSIEHIQEVKSAHIEIVFDPPWGPDKMSDVAKVELGFM
ncbi:MAG: hypothetical protein CMJ20_13615 [Phycisphaeraceae bacterium]|nr:hypothetical protein [Phycisphaeraceae bacterium]